RYYKKGLRKRVRLFAGWINTSKSVIVDISGITPTFTRSMPKNLLEISQYIANLWGKVSKKTLLSQVPFVENVENEVAAVEKESAEALKQQKEAFGLGSNEPPQKDEDKADE
ncbi:MAG: phage portal protein, partial [Hungatella sp.]